MLYSDSTVDPVKIPAGVSFRETTALAEVVGTPGSVYSFHHYSEQSNFSDSDRATGSDGEIWNSISTLQ
ncbi:hypothetical protein N9164_07525 [Draconibacterium sp.]|nr:hypothetical protein [Draconibacterium sp.]